MTKAFLTMAFLMSSLVLLPQNLRAEMIDRVVAFVNDNAITQRELDKQHALDIASSTSRTKGETLEALINTVLMLEDARRLHLWADSDKDLLKKYLDLKVRSAVFVSDRDISVFYKQNKASFGRRGLEEATPEIRQYLEELGFNRVLKEQIARLRGSAVIVVLDGQTQD